MVLSSSADPRTAPGGARLARLPELDGVAPIDAAERLAGLPGRILLESARPGRGARWTFLSADPVSVLESPSPGPDPFAEARRLLDRLDRSASSAPGAPRFSGGLAGFLGYDLGLRFEPRPVLAPDDQGLPPLRLGLYDWSIAWNRRTGEAFLGGRAVDGDEGRLDRRLAQVRELLRELVREPLAERPGPDPDPTPAPGAGLIFETSLSRAAYQAGVATIRAAIGAGQIYQANLARRLRAPFGADPWPLYRTLRTGDPALFAAFIDLGRGQAPAGFGGPRAIASASPEAFLSVDGEGNVSTDPIKGTRPRGATPEADRALAAELLASAKDRAENVMIVDVLRNDLGRACRPGSVRVPRLCRLERTSAVQHLVSTVTGRLAPDRDAFDLLAAAFPGGSITGAPKIRAMEILETLEPVRRGPYTGTALWLGPDGQLGSSILIRTLVADGRSLTLHVGGGITWRSDPAEEWFETVAKAHGPLRAIGGREAAS
ncbi:MAG TPA: anthranilate synthase component I family protein [Candidatus Limnocylindrales bacterium]|jgi:para-aminobenzoate synthetase component 1